MLRFKSRGLQEFGPTPSSHGGPLFTLSFVRFVKKKEKFLPVILLVESHQTSKQSSTPAPFKGKHLFHGRRRASHHLARKRGERAPADGSEKQSCWIPRSEAAQLSSPCSRPFERGLLRTKHLAFANVESAKFATFFQFSPHSTSQR